MDFVQLDTSKNYGSSAKSIFELAKNKDYFPICATRGNLFLIHKDYKKYVVGDKVYTLDEIRDDEEFKNYIFSGYDGSIFTSKKLILPWHNIEVKDLNVLKGSLRKLPKNYNFFDKIIFKFYKKFKQLLKQFF